MNTSREELFSLQPSYDEAAERSILGAMLADPEIVPTVHNFISEADFYVDEHRLLFSVVSELFSKYGTNWDEVVLQDLIRKRGLEARLPFSRILYIYEEAAPVNTLETACRIVKEKAKLRRLLKITLEALKQIRERKDPEEIARYIFNATIDMEEPEDHFYTKSEIIKLAERIIQRAKQRPTLYPGIPSGFDSIDEAVCGLRNKAMYVIASRPGIGKTTYLLSLLKRLLDDGRKVLFISLEMGEEDIVSKFIPKINPEVSFREIITGQIGEEKESRLYERLLEFLKSDGELFLDTRADHTIRSIKARATFVKKKYGLDVLILDYLQLVRPYRSYPSLKDHVSEVSNEIKELAKMLDIPVIVTAQLNRDAERRRGEPTLADIKESGQIEQDADAILLLHRVKSEKNDTLKVILAKNRLTGQLGTFYLKYNPDTQLYEERLEYPTSKKEKEKEDFDEAELDF